MNHTGTLERAACTRGLVITTMTLMTRQPGQQVHNRSLHFICYHVHLDPRTFRYALIILIDKLDSSI